MNKVLRALLPVGLASAFVAGCANVETRAPQPITAETIPEVLEEPLPEDTALSRPERPRQRAVVALLEQAAQRSMEGDRDGAVVALERALRISPRNAYLWQRLALVRLEQGQFDLAEHLAAKSNALAGDDHQARSRNWQIIAQARELRGDSAGAREAYAQAKAASL